MKKILSLILAISMLASLLLFAVGCGEEENPPHEHSYLDGKCECGESDPDYVAPHKHSYVGGRCECGEIDPDYSKIILESAVVDADGGLTFTMSDGSVFPKISLPENSEGIKFVGAKFESGKLIVEYSDGYALTFATFPEVTGEITSLDAKIENKQLILTINSEEKNLGQIFYPTMPSEELVPSGASTYADSRDISGRDISYVEIKVKGYGKITVLLDATTAPITVENFLSLVNSGFYDGLTFHRVMTGFMIQGGDPKADGTGGSGTQIKGEFSANGWTNDISHKRGVISMARRGDSMDSATSQFFICNADAESSLDGQYAAFGYVISGMNIVDEITELTLPYTNPYKSYTITDKAKQAVIESIKVVELEPPHEHVFVNGECECGEKDPNYSAGSDDSYYDPNGWTRP